jgi:hypothetical protein
MGSSWFCFSYVLGAVFLQLCQVLLLSNHPFVQKLIDPSLFIHRFTERKLTAHSIFLYILFIGFYACTMCNWNLRVYYVQLEKNNFVQIGLVYS